MPILPNRRGRRRRGVGKGEASTAAADPDPLDAVAEIRPTPLGGVGGAGGVGGVGGSGSSSPRSRSRSRYDRTTGAFRTKPRKRTLRPDSKIPAATSLPRT